MPEVVFEDEGVHLRTEEGRMYVVRNENSIVYRFTIRLLSLGVLLFSAMLFGFAGAFGGAFAIYCVKLVTQHFSTSLGGSDVYDPGNVYQNYFVLTDTVHPLDFLNSTVY